MKRLFALLALIVAMLWGCTQVNEDTSATEEKNNKISITNFSARVLNSGVITLEWVNQDEIKEIILVISKLGEHLETVSLSSDTQSYEFKNGIHNTEYTFTIYTVDSLNQLGNSLQITQSFYDYTKFENPIISITVPDYTEITTKTWLSDQGINLATCKIIDSNNSENDSEFSLDIKGRGNSSWHLMPKKSYSLKLDKKANLLGIANGKHKQYALVANYIDKTLIRNQLIYSMGNEIFNKMTWNPHTKQVNLFINGTYLGMYLLTERVKINESIVNIPDVSKSDELTDINNDGIVNFSDGGWLIEVNQRLDETYNWKTTKEICISLSDPDDYVDWKKIEEYINKVEAILYNDNIWLDETNGWRKYFDEESFIDWYIVQEISKNVDGIWRHSVYMYFNPTDGKLHMGPLWDFDLTLGNCKSAGCDSTSGWRIKSSGYHKRLFEDSNFVAKLKKRWNDKYNEVAALFADNGKVDLLTSSIFADTDENFSKWNILGTFVWENVDGYEERKTYQSEVDYLKNWGSERVEWLNTNINALK